ncbi:MAG: transporter [Muribaculaceae bacterium]|nr:transporter [Muribaculaceae bacterium]
MSIASVQQRLKPWMMPVAMVLGALFHEYIALIAWVVPYLIFTMLFITFCRIRPAEIRFTPMIWRLLAVQIVGSVAVFLCLRPVGLTLAQSAFICVLCPTATAAPVVTGMLGGDIGRVATYSIISNLAVAVLAPLLFVWVSDADTSISFFDEFVTISLKVAPLIIMPLLAAFLLYFFAPKVHSGVAKVQGVSFYLWSVSLIVVVGRAVSFVLAEPPSAVPLMIAIAVVAALVCVLLFSVGRRIGAASGDRVSAGQGLGQKNTVLAIWMALSYLDPISSIGPAAYIVWQNSINSAQLYHHLKADRRRVSAPNK